MNTREKSIVEGKEPVPSNILVSEVVKATKENKEPFDAVAELKSIKQARKKLRPRRVWRKSKIDKFAEELFALRKLGATSEDMKMFLEKYRSVKASCATINRVFQPRTTSLTTRLAGRPGLTKA